LSFRWAMGGRVYTKIGDGYYYDVEGVRYRRSGEEGQYTYEQVASVFEADNDRIGSSRVPPMFVVLIVLIILHMYLGKYLYME
jgi:hypothetical protein